jgi:hypothetical protein
MRFYILFDKNVVPCENPVTAITSKDAQNFEKNRKKDDEDYDVDDTKEAIIHRKNAPFG